MGPEYQVAVFGLIFDGILAFGTWIAVGCLHIFGLIFDGILASGMWIAVGCFHI